MRRILHSKFLLIFLLILAIIVIFYFSRQILSERKLKMEYEAILNKIEALKKENETLENEIERLKNQEELERLARELYVLKKSGEKVMVVPQEIMQQLEEQSSTVQVPKSFWEEIIDNIKGFFKDLF
ncbi:MAG: septum formation initiator family protein [Patescibacteria group bacterium]|jgi:cell division protein DivIC|nr:septum formation initiator family protein [Patescibacteria group bacterium]